jgi:hypothetical protein
MRRGAPRWKLRAVDRGSGDRTRARTELSIARSASLSMNRVARAAGRSGLTAMRDDDEVVRARLNESIADLAI